MRNGKSLDWQKDLAGLAHELKSPLSAIDGAIEVLDGRQATDRQQEEYFSMIRRNIERLRGSVNDILDVFGAEGRAKLLKVQLTDIMRLCFDEREKFQDMALANKVTIKVFMRNGVPPQIYCDPNKLRLILSNLLSNSIKFTRKGVIWVILEHDEENLWITVQDTGSGISDEDIPHVFEYFYKSPTESNRYGTGFGLFIARAWVEAHGGKIQVQSPGKGGGTKFRFNIPTSRRAVKALSKVSAQTP